MIYVWDNGLDYSDHGIYFIESKLSQEEMASIEPLMRRYNSGHMLCAIEKVDWLHGGPGSLAEVVKLEPFFDCARDPNPNPDAKKYFVGGGCVDPVEEEKEDRRAWEAAKYKHPWNEDGYNVAVNPNAERFGLLTTAIVKELLPGYEKEYWFEAFKSECRERGLI